MRRSGGVVYAPHDDYMKATCTCVRVALCGILWSTMTRYERGERMSVGRLLTVEEAASALGMSEWTLRKMAREGTVPCFKLGGEWRFPEDIAARLFSAASNDASAKQQRAEA